MGKRIMNVLAFLAVLGGSVALTIITGRGSVSTMVYNFAFLAVMAVTLSRGNAAWNVPGGRDHAGTAERNRGTDRYFQNTGKSKK